jgi:transposase InsO family protein
VVPVPGRSGVYRALVRGGRIDPARRRRRRSDYRRWERGRPMELWQMDVVGGVHLAGGSEVKVVTGIDDNSRFVVSAKVVVRATARPVCEALLEALARHGIPEQILTDNGKVFTGRFGPHGSSAEVLFDRVCAENGIRHLLTAPRSPTTTGKVERLHKTMRAEFLNDADRAHASVEALQGALDGWVEQYNTARPHQALGMRPPVDRFGLVVPPPAQVLAPVPVLFGTVDRDAPQQPTRAVPAVRVAGVQRWVSQKGLIRLAGFTYRVPIVFAGEPVEAVVADHLVQIFHREVLVAAYPQRLRPGHRDRAGAAHDHPRRARWSTGSSTRTGCSASPAPCTGPVGPGGPRPCRSRSSPTRSSSRSKAPSCGSTRSATTGPRSTARSRPRTGGPASRVRMRRTVPA